MVGTTHTLFVEADGKRIPVAVSRKRVRNLNLRIRSDGSVALSIPARTSLVAAQAFLDAKATWILKRIRQREDTGQRPQRPQDLATVPLWGTLIPLSDALERAGIRFGAAAKPSTFGAPAPVERDRLSPISAEEYDLLVDELYRRELARALPEVSARAETAMGVSASRWSLRRMKTRWGSCTPATRAIRINTNLAAYPRACLEFVVAHELTHLMEPSHNARFHMLLDIYCPHNRTMSALLKRSARDVANTAAPPRQD